MVDPSKIVINIELNQEAVRAQGSLKQLGKAMAGQAEKPLRLIGEGLLAAAAPLATIATSAYIRNLAAQQRRYEEYDLLIRRVQDLPYRLLGESLIDWGNRIDRLCYLDDPVVRWMYQKAVLQAVFMPWRKR